MSTYSVGDKVNLLKREGIPHEENLGWYIEKLPRDGGLYYWLRHPMGGSTVVKEDEMERA